MSNFSVSVSAPATDEGVANAVDQAMFSGTASETDILITKMIAYDLAMLTLNLEHGGPTDTKNFSLSLTFGEDTVGNRYCSASLSVYAVNPAVKQ